MTDTTPAPETPVANVPVASPESAPAPVAQPEAVKPESATPGPEASTSDKPEDAERPESKPRNSAGERIAQLTAEKRTAEARAAMAQREAARLRTELEQLAHRASAPDLPYEQQEAIRMRQVAKLERLEQATADAGYVEEEIAQKRIETFQAKVAAVRDRMPDFDQVFGAVPVDPIMGELIAESEKAAEVAYYLGKNPQEAFEIRNLPPHLKGARIARIEQKVSLAPRKVSTAPAPVPTVGGQSAPSARDPANMTMAEYAQWRKSQNARA